jgi:glycosyltransferase involved in cell wall biosynthesis
MGKIRVFINYKTTDRPWGGSNSFLSVLKKYFLNLENIELTTSINSDCDIMFLNTAYSAPGKYISLKQIRMFHHYGYPDIFRYATKLFRKRESRIVLRLDGLRKFYAKTTEVKGDRLQLDLLKYADAIIFQSKESLEQFRKMTGKICAQHYVVHNAVDQDIFNIKEKKYWNKKDKLRIFATSWSKNPMKGFKDIARLSKLENVIVNFVGNWPAEINSENVNLKPAVPQPLLAEEYKKNDLFFFPSRNEACPNVVFEALSSGLPVIYHPSGGTPEIVSSYGVELKDDLHATLDEVVNRYDVIIERIKKDYLLFSIDYAGKKYAEVFQEVCK